MRKICTLELLSAKRVQSFRSIREEEVSILIKDLASTTGGLPINFSKMLVNLTNDITSRAAFGQRCEDREAFLHAIQKTIELVGGFSVADLFPSVKFLEVLSGMRSKLLRHREEMDKILEKIIDEHRAASKAAMEKTSEDEADCLLDVLLDLQDQGDLELPLTRDNINAVITKGKVREIVASPCPSDRRRGKKDFFPSRIHMMKTRSGACGCNFGGVEEELVDRIARGKEDDKS
ncbi:hypothetical protein LWI29_013772 [Acer saccharum]|uniref:Cytochrome P450 n=1 Tax=Acer saccharum TaxID=4024 RepID=A0AA39SXT8_ACESA|nr:hypothetical protein LWI29_013772 [Acer saccharum]